MFSEEQIKTALASVKTGADFPRLIKEMRSIGVIGYETYVRDAHSEYRGKNDFKLITSPKMEELIISRNVDGESLRKSLKQHQQGGSGFPEFVRQCAANGIAKWVVSLDTMTCTYYDLSDNAVLVEEIPEVQ